MENKEIRDYAQKHGVKLWEIAEAIGYTDTTFSRKLRRELPSDQRDHLLRVIERIAEYKAEKEADYAARRAEKEANGKGGCF